MCDKPKGNTPIDTLDTSHNIRCLRGHVNDLRPGVIPVYKIACPDTPSSQKTPDTESCYEGNTNAERAFHNVFLFYGKMVMKDQDYDVPKQLRQALNLTAISSCVDQSPARPDHHKLINYKFPQGSNRGITSTRSRKAKHSEY
ncbi:jg23676 [Pararge aegeria aegeria]|uniref:Jg23676 protein n=1 Tax=Pararge aegeria aegeria TaxID=348720 RepID=A0A8S4RCP6_9NEOP|nr:jg23676 [Pararge aegeria aegeria]